MRRRTLQLALALLALCPGGAGWAKPPHDGGPSGAGAGDSPADVVLATASEWGGAHGVYTCDEWRAYLQRMYNLADKRHRGFIDAADFEIVRRVSPVFRSASFDYFDMAGKGRVTKSDFLAFPSPFFARFDKTKTCHVTLEDIRQASAPAQPSSSSSPGERRGGGRGQGSGPSRFGGGAGGL